MGQSRKEKDPKKQCGKDGEGLGPGQGAEQFAFRGLHGEHGQKAHDSGGHSRDYRRCDLRGGPVDQWQQSLTIQVLVPGHFQMPDDILGEHDPYIHHDANGNGYPRKCNDVGIYLEELHENKGQKNPNRQQPRDQDRGPQVQYEHDHHQYTDPYFMTERGLQGAQGLLDQS